MVTYTVRLNDRLRDLPSILKPDARVAKDVATAMDREFREFAKRQFATEGGEGGGPWKPLSPAYKARKDRIFGAAKAEVRRIARARGRRVNTVRALGAKNQILQLTGRMRRAYIEAKNPEHVAEGVVLGGTRLVAYLGVQGPAYYRYHEYGSGRIPARPLGRFTSRTLGLMQAASRRAMIPHVVRRLKILERAGLMRRSAA